MRSTPVTDRYLSDGPPLYHVNATSTTPLGANSGTSSSSRGISFVPQTYTPVASTILSSSPVTYTSAPLQSQPKFVSSSSSTTSPALVAPQQTPPYRFSVATSTSSPPYGSFFAGNNAGNNMNSSSGGNNNSGFWASSQSGFEDAPSPRSVTPLSTAPVISVIRPTSPAPFIKASSNTNNLNNNSFMYNNGVSSNVSGDDVHSVLETKAATIRLEAEAQLRHLKAETDRAARTLNSIADSVTNCLNAESQIRERLAGGGYTPSTRISDAEELGALRMLSANLRDVLNQTQVQHTAQLSDLAERMHAFKIQLDSEISRRAEAEDTIKRLKEMLKNCESPDSVDRRLRPISEQLHKEQEWRAAMEVEIAKLNGESGEYKEEIRRLSESYIAEKQKVHSLESDKIVLQTQVTNLTEQLQRTMREERSAQPKIQSLMNELELTQQQNVGLQEQLRRAREETDRERERRVIAESQRLAADAQANQHQQALSQALAQMHGDPANSASRINMMMDQLQTTMDELLHTKKEKQLLKDRNAELERRISGTPSKVTQREELVGVAGIGLVLDDAVDDGSAFPVYMIASGSSAAESGSIREKDCVIAVDDIPVKGKTLSQVRDCIKGPIGSTVHLTLSRPSTGQVFAISLVRGKELTKVTRTIVGSPTTR